MKMSITLNNEKINMEVEGSEKLREILRQKKCMSVKCGCSEGACGACTILLNNKPVPSCLSPIGIVRDDEIVTLEYFSTQEFYKEIMQGFSRAGIELCGFCNAGKIFAAYHIINKYSRINRQIIYNEVCHLSPCCTDSDTLINGIIYAHEIHTRKLGATKNAK